MTELNRVQMMGWESLLMAATRALERPGASADRMRDRLKGAAFALRGLLELVYRLSAEASASRAELTSQRAALRALLEGLPVAHVLTTNDGTILDVNPAASRVLKVSTRALVGRNLLMFFEDREGWLTLAHEVDSRRVRAERAGRLMPREGGRQAVHVHLLPPPIAEEPGLHWLVLSPTVAKPSIAHAV